MQHDTDSTKGASRRLPVLASVLFMAALTGCLTGGDSGDDDYTLPEGDYLYTSDAEVLGIIPPQGSEPGRLIAHSTYYSCYDINDEPVQGAAVPITSTDTGLYVITGGMLYLWNQGDCTARVYTGSSSKLQGIWTGTGNADSVPLAYRDASCATQIDECEEFGDCYEDVDLSEIFDSSAYHLAISSTGLQSGFKGRYCSARIWGEVFDLIFPGSVVATSGCNEVEFRSDDENKTAILTNSLQNGVDSLSFSLGDSVCVMMNSFGLIVDENTQCSETDFGENYENFLNCVLASGFFGDFGGVQFGEEDRTLGKSTEQGKQNLLKSLRKGVSSRF